MSNRNPFYLLALVAFLISCKNNSSASGDANGENLGAENDRYAYTIAHPNQWELGDSKNIKIALNSLKAYENGNISTAFKDYADSVLIQMDGFEKRLTKDSLLALFLRERAGIKKMGIVMNDFVSLRSKDGRNDYVSLWYKQLWEDQNGRVDSIECMDDLAFKNGKVILWNEKVRRFSGSLK